MMHLHGEPKVDLIPPQKLSFIERAARISIIGAFGATAVMSAVVVGSQLLESMRNLH
jgi:hypothetical protein